MIKPSAICLRTSILLLTHPLHHPHAPHPTPPHRSRKAVGRDATTVYRDRETGRVVSAEEFAAARAKKGKPVYEEVHLEWKGGLAQAREKQEARAAVARESGKAFGR